MQVIIIADDNLVYVEGNALKVDLTGLDPAIHAVFWNGVTASGHIEYRSDGTTKQPPDQITDFAPFQHFVDLWQIAAKPAPPPPPPAPVVPKSMTRRQLLLTMMKHGYITADEAVAAAATGAMPALISNYVNTLAASDQPAAKVTWAAMSECVRTDPMFVALAATQNPPLTSAQLDALFIEGNAL